MYLGNASGGRPPIKKVGSLTEAALLVGRIKKMSAEEIEAAMAGESL